MSQEDTEDRRKEDEGGDEANNRRRVTAGEERETAMIMQSIISGSALSRRFGEEARHRGLQAFALAARAFNLSRLPFLQGEGYGELFPAILTLKFIDRHGILRTTSILFRL